MGWFFKKKQDNIPNCDVDITKLYNAVYRLEGKIELLELNIRQLKAKYLKKLPKLEETEETEPIQKNKYQDTFDFLRKGVL